MCRLRIHRKSFISVRLCLCCILVLFFLVSLHFLALQFTTTVSHSHASTGMKITSDRVLICYFSLFRSGTCSHFIGGYKCNCAAGLQQPNCQYLLHTSGFPSSGVSGGYHSGWQTWSSGAFGAWWNFAAFAVMGSVCCVLFIFVLSPISPSRWLLQPVMLGGRTLTGLTNQVMYSPDTKGAVWQVVPAVSSVWSPREQPAAAFSDMRIYVSGGRGAAGLLNDLWVATINLTSPRNPELSWTLVCECCGVSLLTFSCSVARYAFPRASHAQACSVEFCAVCNGRLRYKLYQGSVVFEPRWEWRF